MNKHQLNLTISQEDIDELNEYGKLSFPCMCGCNKEINIFVYDGE